MAYMNQEIKARIAPAVKTILAKYGVKGSLRVEDHMTLVLNIRSGRLDFINNCNKVTLANWPTAHPVQTYMNINKYHLDSQFEGDCLACLQELLEAMNKFNWDRSDVQTDYFDVGYYVDINIGQWNKPYTWEK